MQVPLTFKAAVLGFIFLVHDPSAGEPNVGLGSLTLQNTSFCICNCIIIYMLSTQGVGPDYVMCQPLLPISLQFLLYMPLFVEIFPLVLRLSSYIAAL